MILHPWPNKLGFEEAEEPEQITNICWIIEKAREIQKNIDFCFTDYAKAFDCVDHENWKILKEMGIPDHFTCPLKNLYAGWEATELDMEQQTGAKLGKEYNKAVYCHPTYLTSMQSTLCETPGWKTHKPEQKFVG